MKPVEDKVVPEVSGGFAPGDDGCFPTPRDPTNVPAGPIVPGPMPEPEPVVQNPL